MRVRRSYLDPENGLSLLATLLDAPSLKAAWDIDWQDPTAQAEARLLAEVDRCRRGSPH